MPETFIRLVELQTQESEGRRTRCGRQLDVVLLYFSMLLVSIGGCRSSKPTWPLSAEQQVVAISPQLTGNIQLDFIERNTDGFLEVEALVRNISSAKVECTIAFQFLDAAGRPLPAAGGFTERRFSLEPGAERVFTEKSSDRAARKFRISASPGEPKN